MIGLLVVAHGSLGASLIDCATYVLGRRPEHLEALDLTAFPGDGLMRDEVKAMLARVDQGDGVLVLSDIYGATPCNTVCRLLSPGRVEIVVGVNVPMLLKTLTYRDHANLDDLAMRAEQGAREGVFRLAGECNTHA